MTALVVCEGSDGTGKSTVVRALAEALSDLGARSWHHGPPLPMRPRDPWSMALHYAAERASLAAAMREGTEAPVVIADRWWHTAAVFGAVRVSFPQIDLAAAEEKALPPPAIVVILDAPDAVLAARRPDASPDEVLARAAYRRQAKRWRWGPVVNADRPVAEVVAEVEALVRRALRGAP
jgi:thymidylate kinase